MRGLKNGELIFCAAGVLSAMPLTYPYTAMTATSWCSALPSLKTRRRLPSGSGGSGCPRVGGDSEKQAGDPSAFFRTNARHSTSAQVGEDRTNRRATMQPLIWSESDRAARLAAIPVGESPANRGDPVTVVVISSDGEGDRSVESLEVKVPEGWGIPVRSVQGGKQPGRPQRKRTSEATKPDSRVERIAGILGVPSRWSLGEGHVGIEGLDHIDVGLPRSERTACQEGMCSESPEPLAGRLDVMSVPRAPAARWRGATRGGSTGFR
jgi:hypothetical protein